ncbi:hypothetical protein ACFQGE_05355 [Halomicroarcula sp. GCM10025817]|uniref:hypothetical protein n=1 Tax=Haloarcula TaxID=2237 RepID=UPI0023E8183D|nr:hypothetical protein [Halomicroarcula sp. SYNS111]
MVNQLDLLAGLLCLGGVAAAGALAGPGTLLATPGRAVFVGGLGIAGCLFLVASAERSLRVRDRRVTRYTLSALGDAAVGVAILGGLARVPPGASGLAYTLLVVLGGASAVLFGAIGLAEKSG